MHWLRLYHMVTFSPNIVSFSTIYDEISLDEVFMEIFELKKSRMSVKCGMISPTA